MRKKIKRSLWMILIVLIALILLNLFLKNRTASFDASDIIRRTVQIQTQDGYRIEGDWMRPPSISHPIPAVILLAPMMQSRQVYQSLAYMLVKQNIAVLSIDMRTYLRRQKKGSFYPDDVANLVQDALAAILYVVRQPGIDSTKLGILGTEVTARTALIAAGEDKRIKAIALVSAVLDDKAFTLIQRTPFRPILVIVSLQDAAAGQQARTIYEYSVHPLSDIESYINAGKGAEIWWSYVQLDVAEKISTWFVSRLYEAGS